MTINRSAHSKKESRDDLVSDAGAVFPTRTHISRGTTVIFSRWRSVTLEGVQVTRRRIIQRRAAMPIFYVLWAIPAVVVLGGGAYWIAHLH
jgi:hypothetical protein